MNYINIDNIEWKKIKYLRKGETLDYEYELILNEPLASWDVYDYWEKERIHKMQKVLKHNDIFFDIGTEQGWCNLVYAQIVGPENMFLIEPTKEFWPNIYQLWHKNFDKRPMGTYHGLIGDKTTDKRERKELISWPNNSRDAIIDRNKYTYLHEKHKDTNEITLDELIKRSGIIPDVLNIDVEGAELLVFKGAIEFLTNHNPHIFVSIHDDLGTENYHTTPAMTVKFLEDLGYKGEFLAENHESHWYFKR